jgi:hypothetical protein
MHFCKVNPLQMSCKGFEAPWNSYGFFCVTVPLNLKPLYENPWTDSC